MDSWFKLDRNYCRLLKRWDISINTLWVLEHLQRHPEGGEPAVLADQVNMLRDDDADARPAGKARLSVPHTA